jgi:ubiquinone/menaquinone biosynthesis C-methylase UbiE
MRNMKLAVSVCLFAVWVLCVGATEGAAQIGQRPADQYIEAMENPRRVENLRVDEVVAALDLQAGEVVADVGSGAGAFTIPMARAVGPTGTVYAVDIDQDMIDYVLGAAKDAGLENVVGVLGEFDDPRLPVDDVNVAFFHRTLHMIEHRQAYLDATAKYMAPDGRVVIVEQDEDTVRNWMWLHPSDVDSWMAAISFYPAKRVEGFDPRWFTIYQRPYGNSMLPGAGR